MAGRSILLLTVASVLMGTGGCMEPKSVREGRRPSAKASVSTELSALARPPVADLPVPIGFKLVEDSSTSQTHAGSRLVDHLYRGRADAPAIARFYKRYMPTSRWILQAEKDSRGKIILDFRKEGENCLIMIEGPGSFSSATIEIWCRTTDR